MKMTNMHQMESVALRRAHLTGVKQVRYRVYQSPTEFIAVIAESALLAIRIAGVAEPYKVMRDMPSTTVPLEKGQIEVPESIERVSLPIAQSTVGALMMNPDEEKHDDEPFIIMPMADIHKKKTPTVSVLSRAEGMNYFGISNDAPTMVAQPPKPVFTPEPPPPIAAADPLPETTSEVLSQDEVAKLLGDV